jgi:hypothetical protein
VIDLLENQGSLFDLYSEPAQPEDCFDCESWLDGRDLKVAWDYCEYCQNSICTSCDALHACAPMLKTRPKPGRF